MKWKISHISLLQFSCLSFKTKASSFVPLSYEIIIRRNRPLVRTSNLINSPPWKNNNLNKIALNHKNEVSHLATKLNWEWNFCRSKGNSGRTRTSFPPLVARGILNAQRKFLHKTATPFLIPCFLRARALSLSSPVIARMPRVTKGRYEP